jgi:hypothetical protein
MTRAAGDGVPENGQNASNTGGAEAARVGGGGRRFILCALVLAGVALALPHTRNAARDIARRISAGVDIKSAVRMLGEGISGEREFTQAIGDAFSAAFLGGDAAAEERDIQASAAQSGDDGDQAAPVDGAAIPSGAALFDDAVTASFAATRAEYSDMLIPAGAPRG